VEVTVEIIPDADARGLATSPLPDGPGRGAAVIRPDRVVPWFWEEFPIRPGGLVPTGCLHRSLSVRRTPQSWRWPPARCALK
jgi:hypothetical protein